MIHRSRATHADETSGTRALEPAAILDMHTRKIVGWSMRQTLHTEIALEAQNMAIERQRPAPGLIHYSDRGTNTPPRPVAQPLPDKGLRRR